MEPVENEGPLAGTDDPVLIALKEKLVPLAKPDPAAQKDRVVVCFQLSHIHCCDDPVNLDYKYSSFCETQEEPYRRRLKVDGPTAVSLDLGWLEGNVGRLAIRNLSKDHKVVLFYESESHGWEVLPQDVFFGRPCGVGLFICCPEGLAEVALCVVPR